MAELDLIGIVNLSEDLETAVSQATKASLLAIESIEKESAPHKTGNLVNAITTAADDTGGLVYVSGAAPYARYVHEGTGIYGPKGQPIRPKLKKALFWAGAAHPVRQIKGIKPNPFADRAAQRALPVVEQLFLGMRI